jgi:septal ring factor EnvC (AmiA/AmiB activator)
MENTRMFGSEFGKLEVVRPMGGENVSDFVEHVRAADTGVKRVWSWVQIAVTIICCGFIAGEFYTQSNNSRDAVDRLAKQIVDLRSELQDFRGEFRKLELDTNSNTKDAVQNAKDIERLTSEVHDLRGQLDTMRNMREAYVYSQSRREKQQTPP